MSWYELTGHQERASSRYEHRKTNQKPRCEKLEIRLALPVFFASLVTLPALFHGPLAIIR